MVAPTFVDLQGFIVGRRFIVKKMAKKGLLVLLYYTLHALCHLCEISLQNSKNLALVDCESL